MDETNSTSFTQLVSRAKADADGACGAKSSIEITTNETLFFRDSSPFDLLRFKIIPEIIDRRAKSGPAVPIRIWSAACSTGQEIYSIAIVLKELLGDMRGYNDSAGGHRHFRPGGGAGERRHFQPDRDRPWA